MTFFHTDPATMSSRTNEKDNPLLTRPSALGSISQRQAHGGASATIRGATKMKRIVQTTTLDSPPAPIFRVLGDPRNVEIIWPQMLRLDRIEHLAHDRWRFQWTRELLGIRFYGLVETVAFPPDYRFLWKITGGL